MRTAVFLVKPSSHLDAGWVWYLIFEDSEHNNVCRASLSWLGLGPLALVGNSAGLTFGRLGGILAVGYKKKSLKQYCLGIHFSGLSVDVFFVSIFEVPAQAPVTSNSNCLEERQSGLSPNLWQIQIRPWNDCPSRHLVTDTHFKFGPFYTLQFLVGTRSAVLVLTPS